MSALAFSMPSIVRNITTYCKPYYRNIVQLHVISGKISDKFSWIGELWMALGERLRQVRELADLSQNELAKRANVPRPIISMVESGKQKSMSLENARRIARVLGVTLDLLAGTGEEETPGLGSA
jgi:DNA-binding XRE family transcriptional regulator